MADAVEEFRFKLAKAKDLPPSWFELVLVPRKFQEHVIALNGNRKLEPSALSLIVIFLEKAGCLEGQTPSEGAAKISPERRDVLIDCAHFMAASLNWDLATLEKGLPPAAIYSLMSSLKDKFHLPLSSSLSDISPGSDPPFCPLHISANVLYHLWIVRFCSNCDLLPPAQGLLWEGTCAPLETIKQSVLPLVDSSVSFLLQVIPLRFDYPLPSISITLATSLTPASDPLVVNVPSPLEAFPRDKIHAQIYFDVGQVLFAQENYSKSLECFQSCQELLQSTSPSSSPYPSIDTDQLRGYVSACSSFDVGWVDGEESEEERQDERVSVVVTCENLRKSPESGLLELPLVFNSISKLSETYRTCLSLEVSDWSELAAMEPSSSKRSRLVEEEEFLNIPVSAQFNLWNVVWSVVEGKGLEPIALKNLTSSQIEEKEMTGALLNVIERVLKEIEGSSIDHELAYHRLSLFARSINVDSEDSLRKYDRINKLLFNNKVPYPCVASVKSSPPLLSSSSDSDPLSGLIPILLSSDPNQMLEGMKSLFKQVPESEHVNIAKSLRGGDRDYITVDQVMNNSLVVAQYNMLMQKAESCLNERNYSLANEFYSSAAQFLTHTSSVPSPLRHRLIPILMETSLRMRIISASNSLRSLSNKQACEKYSALIDEAKSHYSNSTNPNRDLCITTLSGVFLLNLQQYSFLIRSDHINLHERICPKLAAAARCIQEGQDLRRCTRELFETISSVFTTPTGRGGGGDEKQQQQRKYLEVITNNLQDLVSLSYLMAALARLWNIVKKPEFDITIEYTGYWPTAIGHTNSINVDAVLRLLEGLVSYSLHLLPSYSSWLIIQGDIFLTTGDYNSAMKCYLEAGAQESDYFDVEVPESVWNKQVYNRLIVCCLKLNYQSHALIFCQFFDPPNYSFTFSLLKENIQQLLEDMFEYLWDMSIIEYLIYSLGKVGDTIKQRAAVQISSQPELNTNNHREILCQTKTIRKRTFLRIFYQNINNMSQ